MALIIPKSSKKEDRLLSRLHPVLEGTADPVDKKKKESAVKASINLLGNEASHSNLERQKLVMKHLNKDLQPLAKGIFQN